MYTQKGCAQSGPGHFILKNMREMVVYMCMDAGRWVQAPDGLMNDQSVGRGGGQAVPGESSS